MSGIASVKRASTEQNVLKNGTFHKGFTLFKAALIIFCIVAAESIAAYFLKNTLGISVWYPVSAFAAATVLFIVCTILWANGFHSQARRSKHPSYFLTAAILFVICVIIVTMIAVYLKLDLSNSKTLLSYVVVPCVYLLNILFFAIFYHLFATHSTK